MPQRFTRAVVCAAAAALLWSGVSAAGPDVTIDIGISAPPVVLTAPPSLVVVPGTSVYYAPDVPANFFFHKGRYYTVVNGNWSMAPAYSGPWSVIQIGQVPLPILSVPVEYYKIPPGHMKKKGPPSWAGKGHGPHRKELKGK